MIHRVRVVRFKRFADQIFDLSGDCILLAGPNNSGKTTLLHAVAAWYLALRRWLDERGESPARRRIGLGLDEFTALPLREMNLLWLNRHTAQRVPGQKTPRAAPVYVEVVVSKGKLTEESLTIEFLYADKRLVYVRPVKSPEDPAPLDELPAFAKTIRVVHVPAFSGIGAQETHYIERYQDKFIGEGRPGEIVRNLLLDIWNASVPEPGDSPRADLPPWRDLVHDVGRLFQCDLLPPELGAYILCEYRPKPNPAMPSGRPPKLDIANAGSGFHQVLMLLAFFHARPASVLLLDEPDAHLHFILQREIFDHLRRVASRRRCKLIIATHSEVLLAGTEPEQIVSFIGREPRRLVRPEEKQRVQDALRRLTQLDLLQADHVQAVLYVEDESDQKLLREWAVILGHAAQKFLQFPYVVPLRGKGNLDDGKRHFQCLRLAKPTIQGLCILDRDMREQESDGEMPEGLALRRWGRYEIENYLLLPQLLKRFVRQGMDLLSAGDENVIDEEFAANFPANIDYLRDIAPLRDLKGSEFIVGILSRTSRPLAKRDLYMLAELMKAEEIHPNVRSMLDAIAGVTPPVTPSIDSNVTPLDRNGVDEVADVDAGNDERDT